MTDEAGPSGALKPVDAATLAEAEAKYQRGIQCIRSGETETAVHLFSDVLLVRSQHYGELARECASAYFRYGSALLYQAQDSGDVFGTSVKEAADGEEEDEEDEEQPDNKENGGDKGKAPATAVEGGEADEEEGEEGEGGDTDLQLAWENLETAKVIWSRDGEDKNAQQLADVHGLLGDVAMESDDFATALAELDAALAHLLKFVQEDDRRIAEVQYKRCCALQFAGEEEPALGAVQAACDCLVKRQQVLAAKLAAPAEGDSAEQLTAESEDVAALLADLQEKVDEIKDAITQKQHTKDMIKGAMAQLAAVGGGGDPQPAATEGDTLGGGSGGGGAGGAVQNLGVVGRGTKRINLQPVQTNVPPAAAGGADACGATEGPVAKKKRSLEDLMGGSDDTTIGFGAAPAAAAAEAAAAPSPVPAFLQAASVKAVYGAAHSGEQP